jgi:type VI secretion system secreted protein Hcp
MAVVDYFLKIDGIQGESQDKTHKNEIQLNSFSWGASNMGTSATGGGAGAGKVQFSDFSITKSVDTASPSRVRCLLAERRGKSSRST